MAQNTSHEYYAIKSVTPHATRCWKEWGGRRVGHNCFVQTSGGKTSAT